VFFISTNVLSDLTQGKGLANFVSSMSRATFPNVLARLLWAGGLWIALASAPAAESIHSSNLHNAFAATPRIFSGSSPETDAAFADLARLGVKTIISVDGGKPNVEAAKKHGLKYVHLPIGYDGIPTNRLVELVKAAQTLDGPFYVHCHHGKHRGPAAVAVMCEAVAGWNTNAAEQWLRQAGTAAEYPGLYRSAREFKQPSPSQLSAVKTLPEIAATSSLVETMVTIDEHFERLKNAQKTSWRSVPDHPDFQPAHEAALLWEQFREMARSGDNVKRPEDYRTKLAEAERATEQLRALLQKRPIDSGKAEDALKRANQSCSACHKQYRN
jgi:protein tyrosine phosphatase (PTP) superfamily phosphohydrolase (DUF442 family)